jgi:hypothetical protein
MASDLRPRGAGWAPVPGIEPIVAAAGLPPDQISGSIEAVLVDWSGDYDHVRFPVRRHLPADKAFDFGFIDAGRPTTRHGPGPCRHLAGDDRHHQRAARASMPSSLRAGGGEEQRPPVRSPGPTARDRVQGRQGDVGVAGPVGGGRDFREHARRRRAVARPLEHKTCTRLLQEAMEQAWHEAFDHRPAAYWHLTSVTPTIKCRSSSRGEGGRRGDFGASGSARPARPRPACQPWAQIGMATASTYFPSSMLVLSQDLS